MKRKYIIIPIAYILLWVALISINNKAYGFIYSLFDNNLVKIHANLQTITGPMHYIDDKKEIKILDDIYPGLNRYDIELVGDTPYRYVSDPTNIGDLVVYGEFDGITHQYRNIGYDNIPVFKVKYYDYPSVNYRDKVYIFPIIIAVIFFPINLVFLLFKAIHKN